MQELTFHIDLQNGDNGFRLGESKYTIEGVDQQTVSSIAAIESALGTAKIIDAVRASVCKGSHIYNTLLKVIVRQGYDKADWHDVMAEINSVSVNGGKPLFDRENLEEEGILELAVIQLARSEEGPFMYFAY